MSDLLTEAPTECLAPVVDLMSTLTGTGVVPASITVEWRNTDRHHPYVNVWLRYRTDLEKVAAALGLRVESAGGPVGQRRYWTKADGPGVLLQAMSFRHHDDWEGPR